MAIRRLTGVRAYCFAQRPGPAATRPSRVLVVVEGIAKPLVELAEGERRVVLARQHQQRIGVLLRASVRALARLLRHEHDRAHEFMLPLGVRFEGRREKRAVGVAVFVAQARVGVPM